MIDIKPIIAKNITTLRQGQKMTQIELAEKLNYSDKAVSKWERGESIPDVSVLKQIADLFGVTVDYLLQEDHAPVVPQDMTAVPVSQRNRKVVTVLGIVAVWLLATLCYVVLDIIWPELTLTWLSFVYAIPVTFVVWLVLNSALLKNRHNYWIISLLMWSILPIAWLTMWIFYRASWKLLLLGIPGQLIIYGWSKFQKKPKKE